MEKGIKKKILIVSYFFPPCNLTASQRPLSWAKYLHEFGYYPIIITRNWEKKVSTPSDLHFSTHHNVIYQKFGTHEVYYLPYRQTWRDRIYTRFGNENFNKLRQFLTFLEVILQNFFDFIIPFRNFYSYTKKFLSKHPEIDTMIVTANPFVLFKFAYRLKKRFPHLKWIADYRDDWNTRTEANWFEKIPVLSKLIPLIERRSELKWLSNCTLITSVSDHYVNKISNFVQKPGKVIYNGYIPDDFEPYLGIKPSDEFTVSFNGTMIDMQRIEIFTDAFKKFIEKRGGERPIKLKFIGTAYDHFIEKKIMRLLKGYEEYYEITKRINRNKAIEEQMKSHVLLLVSYGNIKGVAGTKTYDYLASGKPIILCPSDQDILEKITRESGQGYVCNTSAVALEALDHLFQKYKMGNFEKGSENKELTSFFTRKKQTEILAGVLDNI